MPGDPDGRPLHHPPGPDGLVRRRHLLLDGVHGSGRVERRFPPRGGGHRRAHALRAVRPPTPEPARLAARRRGPDRGYHGRASRGAARRSTPDGSTDARLCPVLRRGPHVRRGQRAHATDPAHTCTDPDGRRLSNTRRPVASRRATPRRSGANNHWHRSPHARQRHSLAGLHTRDSSRAARLSTPGLSNIVRPASASAASSALP
ncbi:hypothetical protein [Ornithinimicrobium kibberense]|uniref:hypothetical protein n=1 Tax=Ornithinimicrobium kibberense TaxID=282060 RepID=UPI00361ADF50